MLDPANLFEQAEPGRTAPHLSAAIDLLGDRIAMAHAKDRAADGTFVAAGQGVVDFPHYHRVPRGAGFDGPLVTHGLTAAEAPGVASFLRRVLDADRRARAMTAHYTPDGGPRLRVDDSGGPGQPVLFQHGLCGDARQTAGSLSAARQPSAASRSNAAAMAGPSRAIRAHFSIARFADDAARLIWTRCASGRSSSVASPWAAAIAMRLAVTRPDLVRGLVIARPAWSTERRAAEHAAQCRSGRPADAVAAGAAQAAFMAGATATHCLAAERPTISPR